MTQLLLIDDDRALSALLAEYLQQDGFSVTQAFRGDEGLTLAQNGDFDLIVLDIMLPGRDGLSLLRSLRQTRQTPVLMLTARGEDTDTVVGLELGADDYLAKPCSPGVLVARLRALLRRGPLQAEAPPATTLTEGDLELHFGRREVHLAGSPLTLTSVEFDLLAQLMAAAGHVVDKGRLSETALGRSLQPFDRSIDVHISNLRRKLGNRHDGSPRIKTLRGAGYQYLSQS
ncbi:MAG: DNA-binding response regulator [Halomonadaceae bacterium]|nr:MAG: DNA-binding response regulator [Halomonadaceae bacterium]